MISDLLSTSSGVVNTASCAPARGGVPNVVALSRRLGEPCASLTCGSGVREGKSPLFAGVADALGTLAYPMRTGPAPGKISFPLREERALTALSSISKLTKPQFL